MEITFLFRRAAEELREYFADSKKKNYQNRDSIEGMGNNRNAIPL